MKTKLLFRTILLISTICFYKLNAQCPSGNVTFIYQQDVAHFVVAYPNCTHITGNLNIGEMNNFNTTVSDISALSNFTKIDGNLNISNTLLTNLQGLQGLNDLGGNLFIANNSRLASVEHLSNLTETNGFTFVENSALTSLQGLHNLTNINGNVRLMYNNSLQNLSLTNLNAVGGYFEVVYNNSLSSFNGLNNLESIASFITISGNNQLSNLEALENLVNVEGAKIGINDNPQLVSLQGIHNINLSSLEGSDVGLILKNNSSLETCNLPNICNYLNLDSSNHPREVAGNVGNCRSEQIILDVCKLDIEEVESQDFWNVLYEKQNNTFTVQTEGFQMAEVQVYTLSGELVKKITGLNSKREQFYFRNSNAVLIFKIISTNGKVFSKKTVIR